MRVVLGGALLARSGEAMIANFRAADAVAQRQYRAAVQRHGARVKRLVRVYVPVRTGWMRDHVRDEYSPSGLVVHVGWWPEDFLPLGKPFYPPYQELGTSQHPPQPSLYPAHLVATPAFVRDVEGITARSVARLGRVRRRTR
jgi:hypothetical protein